MQPVSEELLADIIIQEGGQEYFLHHLVDETTFAQPFSGLSPADRRVASRLLTCRTVTDLTQVRRAHHLSCTSVESCSRAHNHRQAEQKVLCSDNLTRKSYLA